MMIVNRNIVTAAAILLGILFFTNTADAQIVGYNHPELEWETIETEHFMVHFHNGLDRTPRLIAKIAEEIYEPITRVYRYEPSGKIHFIVRDHDDYANGIAYFYDNKIVIWATPLDFLLRGTTNWLRNVVTHEFTHLIQLQAAMKLPRHIPSLYLQAFGYEDEKRDDVLYGFPNKIISYPIAGVVMPMWFAEGTAQYGASSRGYDAWDTHRDMILRMHALDRGVYSLEEMSVFGKSSIGNESVYNLGFSLTMHIKEKYGEDALNKISREMASPLTINIRRAMKKAIGVDGEDVYNEWRTELESDYRTRTEKIRENLTTGSQIEQTGQANIYPTFSPDGTTLAYLSNGRSDYLSHTSLYLQKPGENNRKRLKTGVESPPSWSPDGKKIVYSKLDKNKKKSFFYDIFQYDLDSKKEKQLTESKRARYPVFSSDGKKIFYVTGADGIQNLVVFEVESEQHRMLTSFSGGEELFNSAVSPDGKKIVLTISSGFGRDLAIMNADGSGFEYLIKTDYDERDPAYSPDGSKLYFSSDRNGIANIYEYNFATGTDKPVTNVLGGAFMPTVNNSGQLSFSLFTIDGYKVIVLDEITGIDPDVMKYKNDLAGDVPATDYDDTVIPQFTANPYKLQYMTSFFLPRLFLDYDRPKLGFYSFSSDALDKYSIFMGAAMNSDLDRDLFAIFDYNKLRWNLFVEMYNMTRHVSFFYEPNEIDDITLAYWEFDIGAREKLTETQMWEFRAMYGRQSANIKPNIPGVVFRPLKYDYYKGLNLKLMWQYNGVTPRRDSEINPAFGRRITLEYWRNSDRIFNDFVIDSQAGLLQEDYYSFDYNKFTIDWREYIGLPFIHDRTALTLRFQGGTIDKPVDDFLYFFAGGLMGIKAYSFYSLEGRHMAVGSATFRFPIKQRIDYELGPWYFDKLYASVGYQAGDAWSTGDVNWDTMKKAIDLGIRLDLFSFYSYPTKIGFNAAYGFDEFGVGGEETSEGWEYDRLEGKKWKFFLTVLFGYDF